MIYLYAVKDDKQVLEYKRLFVDSKHSNQPSGPKYRHKDAYAPNTRPFFVLNKWICVYMLMTSTIIY